MKLELDSKEVEAVLLEYARAKWPGMFNTVRGAHYENIPTTVFTHEDKTPEDKE